MPSLSVVVPATDRPPTLPRCLAALDASRVAPLEVIVVDAPAHLSAAAARNAGVERACGEIVVFVDADVEVHPDALGAIRRAFGDDPGLSALFGSYDDAPHDRAVVSAFRNLLHHHVHHAAGGPATTFWSGLGAVRRSTFLAVDGFDAARFDQPSVEDIDLGVRMALTGARIELRPEIQGTHLKTWTLRSMVTTDFARRGVPWVAMQVRRGRVSGELNMAWPHRVGALACVAAVAAMASRRPAVAAVSVAVFIAVNRSFYALLHRRMGARGAVAGIGLHALHHLVAVASVPVGVVTGLAERREERLAA